MQTKTVKRIDVFAQSTPKTRATVALFNEPSATAPELELVKDPTFGKNVLTGKLNNLPAPIGEFTRYLNDNSMQELWLALTWGK